MRGGATSGAHRGARTPEARPGLSPAQPMNRSGAPSQNTRGDASFSSARAARGTHAPAAQHMTPGLSQRATEWAEVSIPLIYAAITLAVLGLMRWIIVGS
jgi:hypothetical protein